MNVVAYEAERAQRIAENRKRMQELGIHTAAAALNETIQVSRPVPAEPRKRKYSTAPAREAGPLRRSGRMQGTAPENLDEDEMFRRIGIDYLDFLPMRRRRTPMDPEALAALREQRIAATGGGRSGLDSGLGVRLQGGRVYDSKLGVTCHWCRQKTLEAHVECTVEGCGGGSRLPTAFCRMCLHNRHGEDMTQAIESGCWVCPGCRGSCGDGCTTCCNCGPCRKRAGLGPTHQIIKQARLSGFENVHDYLVFRGTGESPEEINARKDTFSWGAWLKVDVTAGLRETSSIENMATDNLPAKTKDGGGEESSAAGAGIINGATAATAVAAKQPAKSTSPSSKIGKRGKKVVVASPAAATLGKKEQLSGGQNSSSTDRLARQEKRNRKSLNKESAEKKKKNAEKEEKEEQSLSLMRKRKKVTSIATELKHGSEEKNENQAKRTVRKGLAMK